MVFRFKVHFQVIFVNVDKILYEQHKNVDAFKDKSKGFYYD